MARSARSALSASKPRTPRPAPEPPRRSNITDETIKKHLGDILPARKALDKARNEQKSANGHYRAMLKAAKRDGISPDAITDALKLHEGDHAEVRVRSDMTRRVLVCMGSEVAACFAVQPDLFTASDGNGAAAPGMSEDPFTMGKKAAAAGEPNKNPFTPGTGNADAWARGWDHEVEQSFSGDA